MALTVEDGSGLAGAEAYISVADATAYFAARNNADWAALTTSQQEAALRQGAEYLDATYGERWQGSRMTEAQPLSWPRVGVVVDGYSLNGSPLPVALVRANAELAMRASTGTLLADQGAQVTQETVGPISVSYADGARQGTRYVSVELMLASLLQGSGQIPVYRA